jgi:hypothetical protein
MYIARQVALAFPVLLCCTEGYVLFTQDWLSSMNIKFYESKMNLNWRPILKSIMDVRPCSLLAHDCASLPVMQRLNSPR